MSAIAGLYLLDGRVVDRGVPARMIETMPHRSPDGSAVWAAGPVGLAHGAFHTTPESLHEVLPLTNEAGTLTITADARIDNRGELIASLALSGRPESIADSELILAAYEAWGEGCVDQLVGDFAFTIWDGPERRLFCARDHFGVKPFYYHHRPGGAFVFGTEIKAILAAGVPGRLNETRVADYLVGMREDAEITIYEGVWRLPASHALTVTEAGLQVRRYYELAPAEGIPQDASDDWYDERFRGLFTEAVRCRVRSAFPVGSQLSGGMDSSAVTCVARDVLQEEGRDLHTFSLVFEETKECDERPYIDAVTAQGGTTPHFVSGDAVGPLSNLDEVYDVLDDGLVGGTQHLVWELIQASRAAGTRVVLDGVDGDNVISHGELYLKELVEAGDWAGFAHETRAMAELYAGADHVHTFERDLGQPDTVFNAYAAPYLRDRAERGPWWRFLRDINAVSQHFSMSRGHLLRFYWKRMVRPYTLLRLNRAWRARRRGERRRALPEVIDPAFADRIGVAARLERFPSPEEQGLFGRSVRETQRHLLGSARFGSALAMTDHIGAMSSVEVRHPFMDKRLIEFCIALPARQSLRDGWTRLILRRALAHTLPEEVTWRVGKAWMTPSFERGLFDLDGERLQESLSDLGPLGAFVNGGYLEALRQQGRALSDEMQTRLAQFATLSFWLKKRFDRPHLAPAVGELRDADTPSGAYTAHQ